MLTNAMFTTIDAEDYAQVSRHKWRSAKNGRDAQFYAARTTIIDGKRVTLYLHRQLMQPAAGFIVDHINGNTLDNRRCNLRICGYSQNGANAKSRPGASRFKGVTSSKRGRYWRARIVVNRRELHLGLFATEEEAARAYDKAALAAFGEFARLNFPKDPLTNQEEIKPCL